MKNGMSGRLRAAFVCHLFALLILIIFGLFYLFRQEYMPYHVVIVGKSWSELEPTLQVLFLASMRIVGGSFLATACALGIILFKPFRQGIGWAYWAIPVIGLIASLSSLYATVYVARNTEASPPWIGAALATLLVVIGFILSMVQKGKEHVEDVNQKN